MNKRSFWNTKKAMRLSLMLCLCYSLVGLYSCHNEDNGMYNKGKLKFQMETDTTLVNSSSDKSSRSNHFSDFEDPKTYKVVISQNSEVVAEFDSYEEMPEEIELEEGQYSIEASKGTETTAAFESPYFSGKQDFTIVKEKTTPVEVTASLQNSLVTVDYSSDFIETYKDYTLSFKTNKMQNPLIYDERESRAMYFQADAAGTKLTIGMSLVNVYDKEVEYTASTTIKPKQWSKLTVRTDGNGLNGIALDVILNDGTKEPVYINIGIPDFMEQLKGAPRVECQAFDWDNTNISMEQPSERTKDECSPSALVNITAGGKINKVLLNLKDNEDNILINNYDLVNLTDEQKAELKNKYGFEVPEEALKQGSVSGNIDLKSIIASLLSKIEESYYVLSLTVIDGMPVPNKTMKSVKINVPKAGDNTITWSFINDLNFDYASYNQGEQTVEVNVPIGIKTALISINGLNIENQDISQTISGINVEKSTDKIKLTFTQEWFNSLFCNEDKSAKQYTVTLNITDNLDRTIEDNSRSFTVNAPVFEWASEIDAFAKYAIVDIKTNNPEKVYFYNDGILIETDNIVRLESKEEGLASFVIKNLNPKTQYKLTAKYNNDDRLALEQMKFETEVMGTIPNGNFEEWTVGPDGMEGHGDIDNYWVGIKYTHTPYRSWERWYPYKNSNEPHWDTINLLTTSLGEERDGFLGAGDNKRWTRYVANSGTIRTSGYKSNYAALIRTVGWGDGNTAAVLDGNMGTCNKLTPGELYLGTYDSANQKASYDGYPLESRPCAISFAYKYIPKNPKDWGVAIIEIKNKDSNIIAKEEKQINAQSNYIVETIKLNYTLIGKAANIMILFRSSGNKECTSTENINLDNVTPPPGSNLTTGEYVGSQLYIDDVKLIYDYTE